MLDYLVTLRQLISLLQNNGQAWAATLAQWVTAPNLIGTILQAGFPSET